MTKAFIHFIKNCTVHSGSCCWLICKTPEMWMWNYHPLGWLFWQAPGMDANKWDFHFIRWIFLSFLAMLPWKRTSCTAASLTVADAVNYFFSLTLLRKVIWICRSFHDLFFHMWVKDSSGLSNFFFFCKFVNPYLDYEGFQWALNASYRLQH